MHAVTGCDERTTRKWKWFILRFLVHLPLVRFFSGGLLLFFTNQIFFQIRWENRNRFDNGSRCRISVDGTDFVIQEPQPWDSRWYSHKHNGPGFRYEIGVLIQGCDIVWVSGPYPCGEWPDLRIARDALIYMLDEGEYAIGDSGYHDGGNYFMTPTGKKNVVWNE